MDVTSLRYKKIIQAFSTLDTAVQHFKQFDSVQKSQIPAFTDFDEMRRTYRDSMIQRFEYCTELFWKYYTSFETLNLDKLILSPYASKEVSRVSRRIEGLIHQVLFEILKIKQT